MRAFLRQLTYKPLFAIVMALILWSCEAPFENNTKQRDTIKSFLGSSHSPVLIPESDVSTSLEPNPNFYVEFGTYAYLYIDDYYNSARESMPQIKKGSKISITFRLYSFTNGASVSTTALPAYSNDPRYEEAYINSGLNTTYWSFEPLNLTIGKSEILKSIQDGLIGCREGDNIEIYMTRNMGYGDSVIGVMEKDSAIAFFCTIDSVIN